MILSEGLMSIDTMWSNYSFASTNTLNISKSRSKIRSKSLYTLTNQAPPSVNSGNTNKYKVQFVNKIELII